MARPRAGATPGIQFFWPEDDPEQVARQLMELSYALDDFKEPLAASASLYHSDIRRRFETGTDPTGRPWEPWEEDYETWVLGKTRGPIFGDRANLHLTGEMKGQMLDPNNWLVTGDALFFDTTDVDDKWAWHQFGASRQTAEAKSFSEFAGEAALFGQNELPPRPMIGRNPLTMTKVTKVFDMWFRGTVETYTTKTGRTFFRGRDVLGRFAKIT